jgi:hypothetical protein
MSRRTKEEVRADYIHWLASQLRDQYGNPDKTYWELANLMFDTEFTWFVPMDDNRVADGLELRNEFRLDRGSFVRSSLDGIPGSFLEVLIGLSRRLAFIAGGSPPGWAWQLLNHLELDRMSDPLSGSKRRKAEEIMQVVMQRTYLPDGTGGFFPLIRPDGDQTRIELWYQLNAFVSELHPEY